MTVPPDGPRDPARPPRAADASQSAPSGALAALRESLESALALLGRAWRELVEIERRASGSATPAAKPAPPVVEPDPRS